MSPSILLEQTAFIHVDAGLLCHEVIGIFDTAVVGTRAQLGVLTNAVKLQKPVFETLGGVELPAADYVRLRITAFARAPPAEVPT